jgi:hypothetical protein
LSGFLTKIKRVEANPPASDLWVWQLEAPSSIVGVLSALAEGYGHCLLMRSRAESDGCLFAVWTPPAFKDETEALLNHWAGKYGFAMTTPHPINEQDKIFGMRKKDYNDVL